MPQSVWDPLSEEATVHPDAEHARLRGSCPVAYSDQFGGFYALTKFDDIAAAAKDPETFTSVPRFKVPQLTGGLRWIPLQSDPPEHGKYRKILNPFFQLRRVRAFEPKIRELVQTILDESGYPREADLCDLLTMPLTGGVLCVYLGFPDSDWDKLKDWTHEQLRAENAGEEEASAIVFKQMSNYIAGLREDRMSNPRSVDTDVMSALLAATVDGEPIPHEIIDGILKLFMGAGHETTNHGLSNLLRYLAEHPDQQQELREDPSLIPHATEEMLRLLGPVAALVRTTTKEVEIRGTTIPAGETVALVWSSAGRDEEIHDDAAVCDFARESTRHLAFGTGAHRCIGADLARMQIRVATEELLARTRSITLAGTPTYRGWSAIGTNYLPVHIDWVD